MGFSDTGSLATLSSGALASAIGAAVPSAASIASAGTASGSRLVDPTADQITDSRTIAKGVTSPVIDMAGSLSFFLSGDWTVEQILSTGEINILWLDPAGTTVLTSRVYEFSSAGGFVINDRCLTGKMKIQYHQSFGAAFTSGLVYTLYGSSRPIDTNRIIGNGGDVSGGLFGVDGLLCWSGVNSIAAGANGNSGNKYVASTGNGSAAIHMSCQVGNGPIRYRFFWGLNPNAPSFNWYQPLQGNVSDLLVVPVPLQPRPLCCLVTNVGAATSQYDLQIWTDPNSHI